SRYQAPREGGGEGDLPRAEARGGSGDATPGRRRDGRAEGVAWPACPGPFARSLGPAAQVDRPCWSVGVVPAEPGGHARLTADASALGAPDARREPTDARRQSSWWSLFSLFSLSWRSLFPCESVTEMMPFIGVPKLPLASWIPP